MPTLSRLGVAHHAVGRRRLVRAVGRPVVDVPGQACDALGAIAKEHDVFLAIPVNERDGGTIYNTILYFGPDGALLGKHRKLMATGGERLAWGMGDGSTLRSSTRRSVASAG